MSLVGSASNLVAGNTITVKLQALDSSNAQATGSSAKVTVVASGSAKLTPTNGVVQLVSGSANFQLRDTKAESVMLSFVDSFSTGLDTTFTLNLTIAAGLWLFVLFWRIRTIK